MPIYQYQILLEDGVEGPVFEIEQGLDEPALTHHPVTGHRLQKIIQAPNINTRHTAGQEKRILDNKYIESKGFTKYERDKLTGDYHRVAGEEGPEVVQKG